MSGYCLDCGNEMCVCNICECEECSQIPTMTFVSFEAYEKLQTENKILKEALKFYASVKNWKYATDSGLDRSEFNDNDDEFIMGEGHVYGKRAREALKRVDE